MGGRGAETQIRFKLGGGGAETPHRVQGRGLGQKPSIGFKLEGEVCNPPHNVQTGPPRGSRGCRKNNNYVQKIM